MKPQPRVQRHIPKYMAIPAGQRAEPDDPWLAVKVIVAAMVLLAFLSVIAPMFPLGPVR